MADNLLGRMWADHHDAFSEEVTRRIGLARTRLSQGNGDPLPLVGRAMALVLAVSLTGLTVSATTF
jgi:hypothetical protein